MKSRPEKVIVYLGLGAVLTGSAYWAGYIKGGTASSVASATASINQKNKATGKTGAMIATRQAGATETLSGLLAGPVHPDADALKRWAAGLSVEEYLANMKQLQDLPAGMPRDDIIKALVEAWARKDPRGFLAGADGITSLKLRQGGIETALNSLAAANPKQAFDWINQNAGNMSAADLGRRMAAAIGGYATVDPQGALNAVVALDDGTNVDRQIKTRAIEGLADSMAQQGRFADAVALFNQLPVNKLQNDALSQLVDTWAQVAPQNAANYISTVQDVGLVNDLGQNLTDVWASTDPAAAAKWAAQMDLLTASANSSTAGGNNNGETLLSNAIDIWSRYDLNAAGQFLNQLPASAAKDTAIVSFVSRAAQDDPLGALNWAASISDPSQQQKAINQVAKQWAKQDPAALSQFLATTTVLTDQQKQAVTIITQSGGKGGGGNNQN